ncbi:prostasin [Discoglossus pictus]
MAELHLSWLGLILLGVVRFTSCQVHSRIVGGVDTTPGQYPWQVSITYNNDPVCGGSLISAQYVLSAAHCFPDDHVTSGYAVKAGVNQLNSLEDSQLVSVDVVKKYPYYSEDSSSGDLALVHLANPVTTSATVAPISLPSSGVQFPPGYKCIVTGWGHIRRGVTLPNPKTMQAGEVALISRQTCNCLYHIQPSSDTLSSIQQDMICAGSAQGTVDACQGDSGGPLACYVDNQYYLAGVISWGDECGAANRPGVYIMVSVYADWIKGIVPDAQFNTFTVNPPESTENDSGCVGADGNFYPNGASIVIMTIFTLPLYWLTAYILTDL